MMDDGGMRAGTIGAVDHSGYFIDGAEAFAAVAADRWLDIATAPPRQQVVVGGSRLNGNGVGSYWWQSQDITDDHGRPTKHPTATHWRRSHSRRGDPGS